MDRKEGRGFGFLLHRREKHGSLLGMKIGIIGTGYVGLVTGACLAEVGHTVCCVDKDKAKVAALRAGQIPIYEPGLEEIVVRNQERQRLSFHNELAEIISTVEVLFLAVGTPPKADYSADLSAVVAASQHIGKFVTKSTVPVGTSEIVRENIGKSAKKGVDYWVASNPEFLREGAAVSDFMQPDRIIVGVDSPKAESLLYEIYKPFIQDGRIFLVTTIRSAEVIKYAANAFLATKISFINEIANFCEVAGATIDDVAKGVGLDSRIGAKYLHAGLGYGGSCFPKDVKALIASGTSLASPFQLLQAVEAINKRQQLRLVDKLRRHTAKLKGIKVAVWGIAFKAKTDDIREAPALVIMAALVKAGVEVAAYDPVVKSVPVAGVTITSSKYDCCNGADALLVVTEWDDFLYPDFDELKQRLKTPLIIDGRNIYDAATVRDKGFVYDSIGRPQ